MIYVILLIYEYFMMVSSLKFCHTHLTGSPLKEVETMAVTRKSVKVADSKVYNTELIYSRVMGHQTSLRDVTISEVILCELSPVPTALFNDSGETKISKSTSELKTLTTVEVSARHPTPESIVTDCYALLWIPRWLSSTPYKSQ